MGSNSPPPQGMNLIPALLRVINHSHQPHHLRPHPRPDHHFHGKKARHWHCTRPEQSQSLSPFSSPSAPSSRSPANTAHMFKSSPLFLTFILIYIDITIVRASSTPFASTSPYSYSNSFSSYNYFSPSSPSSPYSPSSPSSPSAPSFPSSPSSPFSSRSLIEEGESAVDSSQDPSSSSSSASSSTSSVTFSEEGFTKLMAMAYKNIRRGGGTSIDLDEGKISLLEDELLMRTLPVSRTSPASSVAGLASSTEPSVSGVSTSAEDKEQLMNEIRKNKELLANTSYLLDTLLSEDNYDRQIRPGFGGIPTMINTDIEIRSFGPISENDMIYSMDCYFRQTWFDPRLRFGTIVPELPNLLVLSMDWKFLQKVWIPDTYFYNGKSSHMHKVTVPNKFIRIRQDGQLRYSMRLTIKASCPMHLRKYPLDVQSCPLEIGSFAYSSRDVTYTWKGANPVVISEDVTLSQYDFINITTANITKKELTGDIRSSIMVRFLLKRRRGYFYLQIYAPCALIVGASWVSFWINKNDAAGRVSVGATTVLTLVTMGFGGKSTLPRVTYATALDWFVVMCFTFVFTAMVEYACVNYMDKIQSDQIKNILTERLKAKDTQTLQEETLIKSKVEAELDEEDEETGATYSVGESPCPGGSMISPDAEGSGVGELRGPRLPPLDIYQCPYHGPVPIQRHVLKVDFECQVEVSRGDFVSKLTRRWRKREKEPSKRVRKLNEMPLELLATLEATGGATVDAWARWGFPIVFFIINVFYWILFLYIIDDEIPEDFENQTFL